MNEFTIIRYKLSKTELLAQLAEEATELAQAALKYRRACDGTNPTPVKESEALDHLKEEIADVQLLIGVLDMEKYWPVYNKIISAKQKRWVSRLKESE